MRQRRLPSAAADVPPLDQEDVVDQLADGRAARPPGWTAASIASGCADEPAAPLVALARGVAQQLVEVEGSTEDMIR